MPPESGNGPHARAEELEPLSDDELHENLLLYAIGVARALRREERGESHSSTRRRCEENQQKKQSPNSQSISIWTHVLHEVPVLVPACEPLICRYPDDPPDEPR